MKKGGKMGQRAIYNLVENGKNNYFNAHYGATSLSPLLRLLQTKDIQQQMVEPTLLSHILEHLDYEAQYQNPRLDDANMFCNRIDEIDISKHIDWFNKGSDIEMRITMNLDDNSCLMEYNRNCPWYRTMGSYSIPLDLGLQNVEKLLHHAEEKGIENFGALFTIYQNSIGIADAIANSRASTHLDTYMKSPEAEEHRISLRAMTENQQEENDMEER